MAKRESESLWIDLYNFRLNLNPVCVAYVGFSLCETFSSTTLWRARKTKLEFDLRNHFSNLIKIRFYRKRLYYYSYGKIPIFAFFFGVISFYPLALLSCSISNAQTCFVNADYINIVCWCMFRFFRFAHPNRLYLHYVINFSHPKIVSHADLYIPFSPRFSNHYFRVHRVVLSIPLKVSTLLLWSYAKYHTKNNEKHSIKYKL